MNRGMRCYSISHYTECLQNYTSMRKSIVLRIDNASMYKETDCNICNLHHTPYTPDHATDLLSKYTGSRIFNHHLAMRLIAAAIDPVASVP